MNCARRWSAAHRPDDARRSRYKLKGRAACFLEPETQAQKGVFDKVNRFYDARLKIIHGRRKELPPQTLREAFEAGFEVARDTLIQLLNEGPPRDWKEIVLAGTGNAEPDARGGMKRCRCGT